jgi:hypothetical protein
MKYFTTFVLALALASPFLITAVTSSAGDVASGFISAEISDQLTDSYHESRLQNMMVCVPKANPFTNFELIGQCPNYTDTVAYQYLTPPSAGAVLFGLCILVLAFISLVHTCLFGSDREREAMCHHFMGACIHSCHKNKD